MHCSTVGLVTLPQNVARRAYTIRRKHTQGQFIQPELGLGTDLVLDSGLSQLARQELVQLLVPVLSLVQLLRTSVKIGGMRNRRPFSQQVSRILAIAAAA